MLERLITSHYLYPLWRIGWLERLFFLACQLVTVRRPAAFLELLFGFDISKYQGVVDFLKMAAYGAKFLILRCGYAVFRDERFEEYMAAAPGVLPLATYHFYDPIYSPEQQADKVIAILAPHRHKIVRVWLDFEFWWSGPYTHPKYWKIYRDRIKAAGYKVGIYTRATWWDSRVQEYAAEFAKDPVWAAQYNAVLNLIPKGWTKATLWQRGTPAIGPEAGVSSKEIDENLWNDAFDFAEEWGAVPTPPPSPQPGGPMRGTVNRNVTRSLNVRPAAGGSVIAALRYDFDQNKGDVVYGTVEGDRIYFTKIHRVNGNIQHLGQLCSAIVREGSSTYMDLADVPEPGTEPEPTPTLPTLTIAIDGGEDYESTTVELKPKR